MRWFFVLLLGLVVLFAGCIQQPKETSGLKDCGSNVSCFQEEALKCGRAKVKAFQEIPGVGGASYYAEVRGGSLENCSFYLRIIEISLPDNASIEEKMAAVLVKGKEAECWLPVTGDFVSEINENSCKGSLIDLIKAGKAVAEAAS